MELIQDEEIIRRLKSANSREVDETFVYLHRNLFVRISKFVEDNSGAKPDAKDVFQDALVVLYKMARQDKLPTGVVIEGYLFSICRNLWYKTLNKRKRSVELTEINQTVELSEMPITSMLSEERKGAIDQLFGLIGEDCKRLLLSYYFDQVPLKEIATMLGYASEQVAKNKKSACMSKLKELAARFPKLKDLLIQ